MKRFKVITRVTFLRTRYVEARSQGAAEKSWEDSECEDNEVDRDDCCENETLVDVVEES